MRTILILSVILLQACVNKKQEYVNQLYNQSLEKSMNTCSEINQMMIYNLEAAFQENNVKVKPYYEKGIHVKKLSDSFINLDLKSISIDSLWNIYVATIDTLSNQLIKFSNDTVKIKAINLAIKQFDNANIQQLHNILKTEVIVATGTILGRIVSQIDVSFCGFTPVKVETNEISLKQKQYTFSISSYFLQKVSNIDKKTVIDSVLMNGEKRNEVNSVIADYTFAKVVMDSLEYGNYQVFGKVIYHFPNGKDLVYPFDHQFGLTQ